MKKAYIIAFLVISIAMGFTMWAFSSAMTPYVDIRTARESGGHVQVKGKILHETQSWDFEAKLLRFQIVDKNGDKIWVELHKAKPDAFDTAPETAADGMVQKNANGQEVFVADSLVVKCPSKYDDSGKAPAGAKAGGARS